jgi:hypothetical protein
MPKVYCKYCYTYVGLEIGDDVYACSECGAGLAPLSEVKKYGSYKKYQEHLLEAFIEKHLA